MNSLTVLIVIIGVPIAIFLGLLISKINLKLTWKQVLLIQYKVLIIIPLINIISNRINNKKKSLDKLYKIRNKLINMNNNS